MLWPPSVRSVQPGVHVCWCGWEVAKFVAKTHRSGTDVSVNELQCAWPELKSPKWSPQWACSSCSSWFVVSLCRKSFPKLFSSNICTVFMSRGVSVPVFAAENQTLAQLASACFSYESGVCEWVFQSSALCGPFSNFPKGHRLLVSGGWRCGSFLSLTFPFLIWCPDISVFFFFLILSEPHPHLSHGNSTGWSRRCEGGQEPKEGVPRNPPTWAQLCGGPLQLLQHPQPQRTGLGGWDISFFPLKQNLGGHSLCVWEPFRCSTGQAGWTCLSLFIWSADEGLLPQVTVQQITSCCLSRWWSAMATATLCTPSPRQSGPPSTAPCPSAGEHAFK